MVTVTRPEVLSKHLLEVKVKRYDFRLKSLNRVKLSDLVSREIVRGKAGTVVKSPAAC